jgi:DNA-binding LytR/AlgR family response regulator
MRVELLKNSEIIEERLDVHYRQMNPIIRQIVSLAKGSDVSMNLEGKSNNEEWVVFNIRDIFYFESVDKKTFAYMDEQVYEVRENLVELSSLYADEGFVRINKSNVVNIYQIKAIKPEVNMRVRAIMDNGEYLIINRSYKKGFVNFLKETRNLS